MVGRNVFCRICTIAETPSAEILLSNLKELFGEKAAEKLIDLAFKHSGNRQDIDVIVNDESRSYAVENRNGTLSYFQPDSAKWYPAPLDTLKIYTVNFDWLLNAVMSALSIEGVNPQCVLEETIWFIGSTALTKRKKTPIIVVRNINKQEVLEKLDAYLKEKHRSQPALILTFADNIPEYFKPYGQSCIVTLNAAVDVDNEKVVFNITYLCDKMFGHAHEDGFSSSYRTLNLNGETYSFTTMQAEAIKFMDESGKAVHQRDVMEAAGSSQGRIIDLFKGHPAKSLILKSEGNGKYKLIL